MTQYDVAIIGGGLSGLMAAATASQRNKKVLLLSKGAGVITYGSGVVDLLGYSAVNKPVRNPMDALKLLPHYHPYRRIGPQTIADAMSTFQQICSDAEFPYLGSVDKNIWILTAAGTLRPSCLIPKTMNPEPAIAAEALTVVRIVGLKDYCPEVVAAGLKKLPGYKKEYRFVCIDPGLNNGRDISALDVARWLETEQGLAECIHQLREQTKPGEVLIVPPILGMNPSYCIADTIEESTGCRCIELAGMPPAVTGLRLSKLLTKYLRKQGVRVVENADVAGGIATDGRCGAIYTENMDRQRTYYADSFVLATGGFLGGGIAATPAEVKEAILKLPVDYPDDRDGWGNRQLFSDCAQPFGNIGIQTDGLLHPVDTNQSNLYSNVYIVGRSLAGYDYSHEKSGNGVAIASGYLAGISV